MSGDVRVINRQRARAVDSRLLKRLTASLLREDFELEEFDLTIYLVSHDAMAELNWRHLRHEGPTDVITLDYAGTGPTGVLAGEISICVGVAAAQARRFKVPWQKELVRYVVHGALHLRGFEDRGAAARRRMKREEERLLRKLGGRFDLRKLAGKPRLRP